VVRLAHAQDFTLPKSLQTQEAVQVLQILVRQSHRKQDKLKLALQEEKDARRKLQQAQANLQSREQQSKEEEQVHAYNSVIQQSAHRNGDFEVGQKTQMQTQRSVPDTELVQHLVCLIGMFCFGCYCHYTFSKLVP
jgi:hypothetical protein